MLITRDDGTKILTLNKGVPISEQRYLMTIKERFVLNHVEIGLETYIPYGEKKERKVVYIEDNDTGAIACVFEDDIDKLIQCLERYRPILKKESI